MFKKGKITGVIVRDIAKYVDERGWLAEVFREDEIAEEYRPTMGYISMTQPGVARGPHEHQEQTDYFSFLGPSNFKVYLWDNRQSSPTFMSKQTLFVGEDSPKSILIPPGIVHAYKNIGSKTGMVTNYPNRLFAGKGRIGKVDEIRHEDDVNTIFRLD